MNCRAFLWQDVYRFVLPHENGEEALLVEMSKTDRVFSSGWTTATVTEHLVAMGWTPVEEPLPPALAEIARRRLAEDRRRPSEVMHRLGL